MQINTLYKPGNRIGFMYQPRHSEPYQTVEEITSINAKVWLDGEIRIEYGVMLDGGIQYIDEKDVLFSTTGPVRNLYYHCPEGGLPEKKTITLNVGPFYGQDQFCTNAVCASIRGNGTCVKSPEKYIACENKHFMDNIQLDGITPETVALYTKEVSPNTGMAEQLVEQAKYQVKPRMKQCPNTSCSDNRVGWCGGGDRYYNCGKRGEWYIGSDRRKIDPLKCAFNRNRVCDSCDPDCK